MKRILEELYYGNIDPNTSFFVKGSNYGKAMDIIAETENKLMALLEGKERKIFLDYVKAQSEINGILSVEKFIDGFNLGALIMMEVFAGNKGYYTMSEV